MRVPDINDPRVVKAVTAQARQAFWDEVERVAPETLDYLFDVTVFSRMADDARSLLYALGQGSKVDGGHVSAWCDHYHVHGLLADDAHRAFSTAFLGWQLTSGKQYLRHVVVDRHDGIRLTETQDSLSTYMPLDIDSTYRAVGGSFLHWDPVTQRRDEAENRMVEAFKQSLSRALDAREREYDGVTCLDEVAERRAQRHFEWLIRYQMLGESMISLAQAEGVTRQAISHALQRAAQLFHLEPRPPKAGRPRTKRARTVKMGKRGA